MRQKKLIPSLTMKHLHRNLMNFLSSGRSFQPIQVIASRTGLNQLIPYNTGQQISRMFLILRNMWHHKCRQCLSYFSTSS